VVQASLDELRALLERLMTAQRELIHSSARTAMTPSDGTIRRISDLENTIAAVEALIHEQKPARATKTS
jgi:uncharacterized coiled-coil protein SlyX